MTAGFDDDDLNYNDLNEPDTVKRSRLIDLLIMRKFLIADIDNPVVRELIDVDASILTINHELARRNRCLICGQTDVSHRCYPVVDPGRLSEFPIS